MKFQHLEQAVDSLPAQFGTPGCAVEVMLAHEPVFYRTAGCRDEAGIQPVNRDDLYWIYSVTKVFTAVAVLRLIEQGVMQLEDPVSRFLPEWATVFAKGRDGQIGESRAPTVRELLTMTGGLNYDLDAPALKRLKQSGQSITLRSVANALSDALLDFVPGARFQYSLCHDLLGAAAEVAGGQQIEALFAAFFREPLGLPDLTFFPTQEQRARFACEYRYDPETESYRNVQLENPYILGDAYASTGAGICAGIDDLALYADALACGGEAASGARILSPESLTLLTTNQLNARQKRSFHLMQPKEFGYGLGVGVLDEPYLGAPRGVFGWGGAAGADFWVDPENRVSLVYLQHVLDHWDIPEKTHTLLRSALYLDLRDNGVCL